MDISLQMKYSAGFGVVALVVGLFAIFALPADREVKSLGIFLFKLLPFALAAISISLLDQQLMKQFNGLKIVAIYSCFGLFFFFYIPKLFFDVAFQEANNTYYMTLLITPLMILCFTLTFRLGGGSTGNTLRVAFGALTLMLSGLEDLMFMTINNHAAVGSRYSPIPDVWDWASHIKVRLGHFPTKVEAFIFIGVHIALALFIAFYHFRWLEVLKQPLGIE
ncbi:MAG: hypothetical protein GY943_39140 [Chloroflexi bacterium]|nr:hypothetical protein [Chloroflexota bacterium]